MLKSGLKVQNVNPNFQEEAINPSFLYKNCCMLSTACKVKRKTLILSELVVLLQSQIAGETASKDVESPRSAGIGSSLQEEAMRLHKKAFSVCLHCLFPDRRSLWFMGFFQRGALATAVIPGSCFSAVAYFCL